MRRQMCGSCYYCVSCTKGFAKLSKLFLGGNSIPGISRGSTLGMAIFIYVLLSIIPGTVIVSSMFQEFTLLKLSLLVCLLSVSTYNLVNRGKNLIRWPERHLKENVGCCNAESLYQPRYVSSMWQVPCLKHMSCWSYFPHRRWRAKYCWIETLPWMWWLHSEVSSQCSYFKKQLSLAFNWLLFFA